MSTHSDTLDAVLARPTSELEAWLDTASIGADVEGKPFNWQLFAFSVATQATDEKSTRKALVAVRTYERLADLETGSAAFSLMYSAMNLRAWMIRELGAQKAHALLDPEPIASWFSQTATLPIEEARHLASVDDLRTIPVEKLRRLRQIKNVLNTLALIADSGILNDHPELGDWLQLKAQLP